MKALIISIFSIGCLAATAQVPDVTPTPKNKSNNYPQNHRQHTSPVKTSQRPVNRTPQGNPNTPAVRPTPADRGTQIDRSNATNTNATNASTQSNNKQQPKRPFAVGIHPRSNAATTYDTLLTTGPAANTTVGTVVPGGNDTTFNVHTIAPAAGVGSNSGAVDRSGQAQFGQSNWGRNEHRNTVGESQWTIPPPITASFNREFPAQQQATWVRNQVDTNQYSVRYRAGANWVTSTYDASGTRINMRTEMPLAQPPNPVAVFIAKQPSTFRVVSISRVQMQGRPEVYELKLENGRTTYVNNDGMEVRL